MKKTTISAFLNEDPNGYPSYWKHENQNKNTPDSRDLMKVVERKIMYAAKTMTPQLSLTEKTLTRKLASETGIYHVSGEASVQDTIKGMASIYKREPETVMLNGIGSFPTSASNLGTAARYSHIGATPLAKQIFVDFDFVPHSVDDSGEYQPDFLPLPYPVGLIQGYKGIGVGKACYIAERKIADVYKWSRKVIDRAYPDSNGSHFSTEFLKDFEKNGTNIKTPREMREFATTAKHADKACSDSDLRKFKVPDPTNFTGAICTANGKKVMMSPRIETEGSGRSKKYFITALPIESSDKLVQLRINKVFGTKILDKVSDHSGEGHPVKLEIPASIATDKSVWMSLKMQKEFTECYVIWDKDLGTARVINDLFPLVIDWYLAREETVTKRLVMDITKNVKKIHNNNLIKQYFDLDQSGKIKTEKDTLKFFNNDDARFLVNLPEKTYIKENVDKLQEENKKLEATISGTKNNLENIKDFIFNEWTRVAKENKAFIEKNGITI